MQANWKKTFGIIYAGQAFSILGSAAVQFAIIWWLTVHTESAISLTTATIAGFLPMLLIGPFAGVWVDRFNRRTVMMAADGFVALSSVLLAAVFLQTTTPPLWFIYLILFLRGLGSTFHMPAMQAAMPLLVPMEMLEKAGGWSNLISSLSNMLGPVIGAALMSTFPIAAIMLVDIFGAVFAVICLIFVRIPDVPRSAQKRTVGTDLKQGFTALRANKPLMAVFFPCYWRQRLAQQRGGVRLRRGASDFFSDYGGVGRHEATVFDDFPGHWRTGTHQRPQRIAACGGFLGLFNPVLLYGLLRHVCQRAPDGLHPADHCPGRAGQGALTSDDGLHHSHARRSDSCRSRQ